jgi:hypothetical protein
MNDRSIKWGLFGVATAGQGRVKEESEVGVIMIKVLYASL